MGLILPGEDVHDIARLVQGGDPVLGWRGDPTMDVYLDEVTGEVAVYAFDVKGERYRAATESTVNPGWRHDLIRRLRDGDWRRSGEVIAAVERHNDAVERRRAKEAGEVTEASAEKLAWALRRDLGAYVSGTSRELY